ncbi:MAG: TIGR01459 family HAD-type hydrolase [Holosporaceae bacterium]|nr:MAG: TIGR01459 family HAD-type hydrolase [Holosporaceae bacterium]
MHKDISPQQEQQTFSTIHTPYTHFLLDMWGVVHDGCNALPGAIHCLENLRAHDKKILFISNSSRPGHNLEQLMNGMGIERGTHYDHIHSSGDAVIDGLNDPENDFSGKDYYYLGDDTHAHPLLEHISGKRTLNLEQADYILFTALVPTTDMVLEEALRLNKTLICANPDVVAIHGGKTGHCPGLAAQKYEKNGGIVIYYGKPYPPIYESSLKKLGNPPKEKVLAVGDGMHTDIKGANTMGLDVVLIHSGIHRDESRQSLEKTLKTQDINPTFIMDRFMWNKA